MIRRFFLCNGGGKERNVKMNIITPTAGFVSAAFFIPMTEDDRRITAPPKITATG